MKTLIVALICFVVGAAAGGWLLSHTQRRPLFKFADCQTRCYNQKEILGLLTSIGIAHSPQLLPAIVKETDKTLVIKNPRPETKVDYLVIPKKDIKDPGDIQPSDQLYISDAYAVMAELIHEKGLAKYRIIANGPGYQEVTYLHFHLMSNEETTP